MPSYVVVILDNDNREIVEIGRHQTKPYDNLLSSLSHESHSSAFSQAQNFPAQHEDYSQKLLHEARGHLTKLLLETLEMDAQLQRIAACSGSANFGEVMATARRVNLGDCDSCYLGMGDYFRGDAMPSGALASSGIHKNGAA